jgi:hypothetical protein
MDVARAAKGVKLPLDLNQTKAKCTAEVIAPGRETSPSAIVMNIFLVLISEPIGTAYVYRGRINATLRIHYRRIRKLLLIQGLGANVKMTKA